MKHELNHSLSAHGGPQKFFYASICTYLELFVCIHLGLFVYICLGLFVCLDVGLLSDPVSSIPQSAAVCSGHQWRRGITPIVVVMVVFYFSI